MSFPASYSVVFWTNEDVVAWFEALGFETPVIQETKMQGISGSQLLAMVNNDALGRLGLTSKVKVTQLLWNLERRISAGDVGAQTALDPKVFEGVSAKLALQQQASSRTSLDSVDLQSQGSSFMSADGQTDGSAAAAPGGMQAGLDLLDFGTAGGPGEAPAPPPEPRKSLEGKRRKSKRKKETFNLIDLGDEGEDGPDDGEESEEEPEPNANGKAPPAPPLGLGVAPVSPGRADRMGLEYEAVFEPGHAPNILLEEFQPGNKLLVKGFPKRSDGRPGFAEQTGKIEKGDFLMAVNGINLQGFPFRDAIRVLTEQPYPLALKFKRVPRHLREHTFENWSINALRSVLLELGLELTGLERHQQLVNMAKAAFSDKPVPLPPAPPKVEPGVAAIINGETSVCGWLLMKGPHDKAFKRVFCDLHGGELLYHTATGAPTGETQASYTYDPQPAGSLDMSKMRLVALTRTSEEGQRDLRLVNEEEQVWLFSANREDALKTWLKKLSTAQIIGPGSRTSGLPEPGAPFLMAKSSNSLTVMWLPPRQPFLNSVHSFQVAYKEGVNPLKNWRLAADECHSTKLVIKGLQEGEKYYVRVRAYHELERGQMVWGEWSEKSQPLVTDREQNRPVKPSTHLWVLVHGLKGDAEDFDYVRDQLESRHGFDACVLISCCNSAPFKTLDGIAKGGTRLFEEVMQVIERVSSLLRISFIGHGLGGLYARYCIKMLDENGIFSGRLTPLNLITLGTPHAGSKKSSAGVVGKLFGEETAEQLTFKDADARSGRQPLLVRMASEEYLQPLRKFHKRVAYANVRYDGQVEFVSASMRLEDPYAHIGDSQLEVSVDPHYSHVLVMSAAGRHPELAESDKSVSELAALCPTREMWLSMVKELDLLEWERVDIFNPDSYGQYNDLIVTNEVLRTEGKDIVRHLVDHALNSLS